MEGRFNGVLFALPVWGAYIWRGRAYTWRGLFSEFYAVYTGIQDTTKMTACVVAGKRNNGKARENWWDDKAVEKGGARKDS